MPYEQEIMANRRAINALLRESEIDSSKVAALTARRKESIINLDQFLARPGGPRGSQIDFISLDDWAGRKQFDSTVNEINGYFRTALEDKGFEFGMQLLHVLMAPVPANRVIVGVEKNDRPKLIFGERVEFDPSLTMLSLIHWILIFLRFEAAEFTHRLMLSFAKRAANIEPTNTPFLWVLHRPPVNLGELNWGGKTRVISGVDEANRPICGRPTAPISKPSRSLIEFEKTDLLSSSNLYILLGEGLPVPDTEETLFVHEASHSLAYLRGYYFTAVIGLPALRNPPQTTRSAELLLTDSQRTITPKRRAKIEALTQKKTLKKINTYYLGSEEDYLVIQSNKGENDVRRALGYRERSGYNAVPAYVRHPIMAAILDKNPTVLRRLLESPEIGRVDINAIDSWSGRTALYEAVAQRETETAGILLNDSRTNSNAGSYAVPLSTPPKLMSTPLDKAVREHHPEMVKLLLTNIHTDVNLQNRKGNSPLTEGILLYRNALREPFFNFAVVNILERIIRSLIKHPNVNFGTAFQSLSAPLATSNLPNIERQQNLKKLFIQIKARTLRPLDADEVAFLNGLRYSWCCFRCNQRLISDRQYHCSLCLNSICNNCMRQIKNIPFCKPCAESFPPPPPVV